MNERIIYMVLIIAGILCSYRLIRPFIALLINYKSFRLLSYIMSSLVILLLLFFMTLSSGEIMPETYQLLKFVLQASSIFGLCLLIGHFVQYVRRRFD